MALWEKWPFTRGYNLTRPDIFSVHSDESHCSSLASKLNYTQALLFSDNYLDRSGQDNCRAIRCSSSGSETLYLSNFCIRTSVFTSNSLFSSITANKTDHRLNNINVSYLEPAYRVPLRQYATQRGEIMCAKRTPKSTRTVVNAYTHI